jgi:hypothetical protein
MMPEGQKREELATKTNSLYSYKLVFGSKFDGFMQAMIASWILN